MPPDSRPSDSAPADSRTVDPRAEIPPEPPAEALPALIEALLFVSDGPVEPAQLARALNVSRRRLERALQLLSGSLAERGVRLQTGPEGTQLVTAPEAARYVQHFLGLEANRRLSNAALETLAIVAYRQPVTRATVESIRGVNSDAAIATLRARGLIAESGRAPGPGRPALFVTTQRFLEHFGLERPDELPPLEEPEPQRDAPQQKPYQPDEDATARVHPPRDTARSERPDDASPGSTDGTPAARGPTATAPGHQEPPLPLRQPGAQLPSGRVTLPPPLAAPPPRDRPPPLPR